MSKKISALGLDIGLRRVGIAGCDGLGIIATPLTTLVRSSFEEDVKALQQIVTEREITVLVIGLPYNKEGEIGHQAKQVIKYAERVGRALDLPLEFMDERYTSVEAEEQIRQQKKRYSPRKDKALIDQRAAAIILQLWLDSKDC